MGRIVLVTGGARSGKSAFAEQYAAACGGRVAYIATAEIYDEEMSRRVELAPAAAAGGMDHLGSAVRSGSRHYGGCRI